MSVEKIKVFRAEPGWGLSGLEDWLNECLQACRKDTVGWPKNAHLVHLEYINSYLAVFEVCNER